MNWWELDAQEPVGTTQPAPKKQPQPANWWDADKPEEPPAPPDDGYGLDDAWKSFTRVPRMAIAGLDRAGRAIGDLALSGAEAVARPVAGLFDQEAVFDEAMKPLRNTFSQKRPDIVELGGAYGKSMVDDLGVGLAQGAASYATGAGILGPARAALGAWSPVAAGAIGDFVGFDGQSPNLSNLIEDATGAKMATAIRADDSELEGRAKNVIEGGMLVGPLAELMLTGARGLYRRLSEAHGREPTVDDIRQAAATGDKEAEAVMQTPEWAEHPAVKAQIEAGNLNPDAPNAEAMAERVIRRAAEDEQRAALPAEADMRTFRDENEAVVQGDMADAARSAYNVSRAPQPDVIPVAPSGQGILDDEATQEVMRIVANRNRNLPAVVEQQPNRMTPEEIAQAQRRAQAGRPAGPELDQMVAPEGRAPQTRDDMAAQREAEAALAVAGQRRGRYEDAVAREARTDIEQPRADTRAGGRPEEENRQTVAMVGDTPVRIVGPTSGGRMVVEPVDAAVFDLTRKLEEAEGRLASARTSDLAPSVSRDELIRRRQAAVDALKRQLAEADKPRDGEIFTVDARDIIETGFSKTERMAQEFSETAERRTRGVGYDDPGPRRSVDTVASRQVGGLRGDIEPPAARVNEAPPREGGPTIDGEVVGRSYRDPSAAPDGAPRIETDMPKPRGPMEGEAPAPAAGDLPAPLPQITGRQPFRDYFPEGKPQAPRPAEAPRAEAAPRPDRLGPDELPRSSQPNRPAPEVTLRAGERDGNLGDVFEWQGRRYEISRTYGKWDAPIEVVDVTGDVGPVRRAFDSAKDFQQQTGIRMSTRAVRDGAKTRLGDVGRTITQEIRALGGISMRDARDISGDNKSMGGLFTRNGMSADEMAEALTSRGWFGNPNERYRNNVPVDKAELVDAIRRDFDADAQGQPERAVYHPEDAASPQTILDRRQWDADKSDARRLADMSPREIEEAYNAASIERQAEIAREIDAEIEARYRAATEEPVFEPRDTARDAVYNEPYPSRLEEPDGRGLDDTRGQGAADAGPPRGEAERPAPVTRAAPERGAGGGTPAREVEADGRNARPQEPAAARIEAEPAPKAEADIEVGKFTRQPSNDPSWEEAREWAITVNGTEYRLMRNTSEEGYNTGSGIVGTWSYRKASERWPDWPATLTSNRQEALDEIIALERKAKAEAAAPKAEPPPAPRAPEPKADTSGLKPRGDDVMFDSNDQPFASREDAQAAIDANDWLRESGFKPVQTQEGWGFSRFHGDYAPTAPRRPQVEKTDQGDQFMLDGTTRAEGREGPKRASVPQKDADEGLFAKKDIEEKTGSLFNEGRSTLASGFNPIVAVRETLKLMDDLFGLTSVAREVAKGVAPQVNRMKDGGLKVLGYRNDAIMRAIADKYNSPTLTKLADMFHARAGQADGTGRTYEEAVRLASTDKLTTVVKSTEFIEDMPEAQRADAYKHLRDLLVNPNTKARSPAFEAARKELAADLKDFLAYRKAAGEDIGEVRDGYFPRLIDFDKVRADKDAFIAAAKRAYTRIGNANPKEAAERYYEAVLAEGMDLRSIELGPSIEPLGVARTSSQAREFDKAADALLGEFYITDVRDVLAAYYNSGARRAEFVRRFGAKGPVGSPERAAWEKLHGKGTTQWEVMSKQIADEVRQSPAWREGADPMRVVEDALKSSLGIMGTSVSNGARKFASLAHTWNIIRTLDRALLSSLAEAYTVGMRTASFRASASALKDSFAEFGRAIVNAPESEARRLAEDLSFINTAIVESLQQSRAGALIEGKLEQKLLAGFFKAIGLHQWTESTRIAAMNGGQRFIQRLAEDVGEGGAKGRRADFYLRELGITDTKAFADFVNKAQGKPTTAEILADKGQAAVYRTALTRFIDQTIMNPSRANKPKWANHPTGGLFYGLMSWSYGFKANVLDRQFQMGKKAIQDPEAFAGDFATQLAAGWLPIILTTWAVDTYVRPALFGGKEQNDKRKDEDWAMTALRVADRAGLSGPLSPVLNGIFGLKYQRDPATVAAGPTIGAFMDGLGAIGGLTPQSIGGSNAASTDTAERKAIRTTYRLVVEPALDTVAILSPGAIFKPVGARTLGILGPDAAKAEDHFVDGVSSLLGLQTNADNRGSSRTGRDRTSGRETGRDNGRGERR